MATINHLASINTSTNDTAYTTNTPATFTPTAGGLMFVIVGGTGTIIEGAVTSSDGNTFLQAVGAAQGGANRTGIFVAEQVSNAVAQTVTWTITADGATAAEVYVGEVVGLSRVGLNAVRQSIGASHAAAGTPVATLPAAALTGNPLVGSEYNLTNAAVTEPATWTELADLGSGTPTSRLEYASINSGFTSDTITWGSAPASAGRCQVVEFDASSDAGPALNANPMALLGVGRKLP